MVGEPVALTLRELKVADLDALMAIEVQAYPFPWSRGNFVDSLASQFRAVGVWVSHAAGARLDEGVLVAYAWAMEGVDELHLLNITVHPDHQGRGYARRLLDDLLRWGVGRSLTWMWLEVRASNDRARTLYQVYGFDEAGLRRGYYPTARSAREDAVLMRLNMPDKLRALAADGLETPGTEVGA